MSSTTFENVTFENKQNISNIYKIFSFVYIPEVTIKQKLKDFGVLPAVEYLHKATGHLGQGASWVNDRLDESFPGYRKTITDALEPYVYLITNTGKLVCIFIQNMKEKVLENYPLVLQNVRKNN